MENENRDFGWALARIATGIVMAYYGSQKALGLFGGSGFSATVEGMSSNMGIPEPLVVLAILAEFLGGLGLVVGLLSRVAGFGVFVTMMVAMVVNANRVGGFGVLATGIHDSVNLIFYTFVLGMVALGVVIQGAGAFSLDTRLGIESRIGQVFSRKSA
ncbi:hypothetical protein C0431_11860 [bacterium]|nr:hypothetical protein [bacterium]